MITENTAYLIVVVVLVILGIIGFLRDGDRK